MLGTTNSKKVSRKRFGKQRNEKHAMDQRTQGKLGLGWRHRLMRKPM